MAELSQQAQSVPSSARIQNLSILDVVNRDPRHGYFSARVRILTSYLISLHNTYPSSPPKNRSSFRSFFPSDRSQNVHQILRQRNVSQGDQCTERTFVILRQ